MAKIVIAILLSLENFLVSRFSFRIRKFENCVITNHHKNKQCPVDTYFGLQYLPSI